MVSKTGKVLISPEGSLWFVKNLDQDFHTQFGVVQKSLLSKKSGSIISTSRGQSLTLLDPSFIDCYSHMKRGPQIVARKDVGRILTETGVGKKSVVVDAGGGSGALCFMLAQHCRKVVVYEVREDFFGILEYNQKFLGVSNLTLKNEDIYGGIAERNVDLVTLDLPEPWKVVDHAAKALKPGGFLVVYSPTVPQVMDVVAALKKQGGFLFLKALELLEREWEVEERKVRPKSLMTGHTGFLVFCRRLGAE